LEAIKIGIPFISMPEITFPLAKRAIGYLHQDYFIGPFLMANPIIWICLVLVGTDMVKRVEVSRAIGTEVMPCYISKRNTEPI
jgi:hypothetical protein